MLKNRLVLNLLIGSCVLASPFQTAGAGFFGIFGKQKTSCAAALSLHGDEQPISEILGREPHLIKLLAENPWAQGYALTLSTLGESTLTWSVSASKDELIGEGVWTPSVGPIRVVISKNPPNIVISPANNITRPTEFYVEVFVHPSRLDNAKAVVKEAAAALREERQTGDFPQICYRFRS